MRDSISRRALRNGRPSLPVLFAVVVLFIAPARADGPPRATESGRWACELGVILALTGEPARAESVFIDVLSRFPGHAAVYTNLGNLRLLEGDPGLALAFYRRARQADPTDPGILLDQATAYLLFDDPTQAVECAQQGLDMAGGAPAAAALLGLRFPENPNGDRGAAGARLSREEVLDMLRAAAGRVPADSTRAGQRPDSTDRAAGKPQGPLWRPAGPRGNDAQALPSFVYWKR